jgi:hypothetical protein
VSADVRQEHATLGIRYGEKHVVASREAAPNPLTIVGDRSGVVRESDRLRTLGQSDIADGLGSFRCRGGLFYVFLPSAII